MRDVLARKKDKRRTRIMRRFKPGKGKRNNLAAFRVAHGLEQKQMASILMMSIFHYNLFENGKKDVKLIYLTRLQEVFGLTDDETAELLEVSK